jgi:hypothetical protein
MGAPSLARVPSSCTIPSISSACCQSLLLCRFPDDEGLPEEERMYRTSAGALCPHDSAQGVVERFCTTLPGHSS